METRTQNNFDKVTLSDGVEGKAADRPRVNKDEVEDKTLIRATWEVAVEMASA